MHVEDNQGFHLKKELGSADLGQSGNLILKLAHAKACGDHIVVPVPLLAKCLLISYSPSLLLSFYKKN